MNEDVDLEVETDTEAETESAEAEQQNEDVSLDIDFGSDDDETQGTESETESDTEAEGEVDDYGNLRVALDGQELPKRFQKFVDKETGELKVSDILKANENLENNRSSKGVPREYEVDDVFEELSQDGWKVSWKK